MLAFIGFYHFLCLVVFDIELYSAELDDVASIESVVEVVLGGFGIANHNKHFVIDVFVADGVALIISWSASHDCVILHLEGAVSLSNDNHRFGIAAKLLWLGANANKLHIVVHAEDLPSSLGLDVFLCNVFTFVVEEPVRVPAPSNAAHVHLVVLPLTLLKCF